MSGRKRCCPVIHTYKPRRTTENLRLSGPRTGISTPYLPNRKNYSPSGLILHIERCRTISEVEIPLLLPNDRVFKKVTSTCSLTWGSEHDGQGRELVFLIFRSVYIWKNQTPRSLRGRILTDTIRDRTQNPQTEIIRSPHVRNSNVKFYYSLLGYNTVQPGRQLRNMRSKVHNMQVDVFLDG